MLGNCSNCKTYNHLVEVTYLKDPLIKKNLCPTCKKLVDRGKLDLLNINQYRPIREQLRQLFGKNVPMPPKEGDWYK